MSFLGLGTPNSAAAGIVSSGFDTGYETTARTIAAKKKAEVDAASDAAQQSALAARNKATIDAENERNTATLKNQRLLRSGGLLEASLAGDEQKFSNIAQHPEIYGAEGVAQAQKALQSISANRIGIGAQIGANKQPQLTDPTFTGIGAVGIAPSPQFLDTQALKPVKEKLDIAQKQALIEKSAQGLEMGDQKIGGNYLPNRNYRDPKTGKLTRGGFLSTSGASGTSPSDLPEDVVNLHAALGEYAAASVANQGEKPAERAKRVAGARGKTYNAYPFVIDGMLRGREGFANYNGEPEDAAPGIALGEIQKQYRWSEQEAKNPANRDKIVAMAQQYISQNANAVNPASTVSPEAKATYAARLRSYQNLIDALGGGILPSGGGK